MNNKKSQNLSFETIAAAILVLLVIVVIILIFTGNMQRIANDISRANSCESRKGICSDSQEVDGYKAAGSYDCLRGFGCPPKGQENSKKEYCCIPSAPKSS